MKPGSALYALVLRAADRFGTAEALAQRSDISLSALLRGAKAGQLSADTLLAVAEAGGVDPMQLLAAAGKKATADRIRRMFGPPRPPLSTHERRLLALDDASKRQLCRLIDGLTK